MASYYEMKARAASDLSDWIVNENRTSFTEFCRDKRKLFGFDDRFFLRIIEKDYPMFKIENGKLMVKNPKTL